MVREQALLILAHAIEFVTKRIPNYKGSITDIVVHIFFPNHGRPGEASEEPVATLPKVVLARELSEKRERDRLRKAARKDPLNPPEKRKAHIEPTAQDTPAKPLPSPASNKKVKTRLESHREPITPSTRGINRHATTSVPTDTPSTKQAKHKFETHKEPLVVLNHGKKHTATSELVVPAKKCCTTRSPDLGEAKFEALPDHVARGFPQSWGSRGSGYREKRI